MARAMLDCEELAKSVAKEFVNNPESKLIEGLRQIVVEHTESLVILARKNHDQALMDALVVLAGYEQVETIVRHIESKEKWQDLLFIIKLALLMIIGCGIIALSLRSNYLRYLMGE
jgi:hypothetical protein